MCIRCICTEWFIIEKVIRGGEAGKRGAHWHKVTFTLDFWYINKGLILSFLVNQRQHLFPSKLFRSWKNLMCSAQRNLPIAVQCSTRKPLK